METVQHDLTPPPLEELASVLNPALRKNYIDSSVAVVQCPDLRTPPFLLAAEGLSGNECIAEVGGPPHLFPQPLLDHKYSLIALAETMKLPADRGMLLGAGAGPFQDLGRNSELAPNLSWAGGFEHVNHLTRYAVMEDGSGGAVTPACRPSPSTNCALMANLFGSAGVAGPVLRVTARSRQGEQASFIDCLRHALHDRYGDDRQIGLGGVFVMKKGKASFHIMPDFPPPDKLPFKDREQFAKWLTFHEFAAPMVCLTVFHSCDPEKLDLRLEHTHCFSADGKNEGGHYHHDLPTGEDGADEVEYEAYLNTAKTVYRIDRPKRSTSQSL